MGASNPAPTKPGWYWLVDSTENVWRAVEVTDQDGILVVLLPASGGTKPLAELVGRWGPQVVPPEYAAEALNEGAKMAGILSRLLQGDDVAKDSREVLKRRNERLMEWCHASPFELYKVGSRSSLPRSVELEETRGGEPLRAIVGGADGVGLKLRHDGRKEFRGSSGGASEWRIAGWTRAVVLTYAKRSGKARFYDLRPGPDASRVGIGPFEVTGRFEAVEKENNARKARMAFESAELMRSDET